MKIISFASVESFTGGAFASKLVKIPGASKFFKGSLVTYSNEVKEKFGINTSNGVISKEISLEMAKKGKEYFDVDYCFSFTGNAGPISMENKEVGLVYISLNEEVYELNFGGSREDIISQSIDFAFEIFQKLTKYACF